MRFTLSLVTFYLASVAFATVIPVDSASSGYGYGHGYGYGEPESSSTDVANHGSTTHDGVQSTGVPQPATHSTTTVVGTAPHSSGAASNGGSQSSAADPDPQSSACTDSAGGGNTVATTTAKDGSVITKTMTVTQKPTQVPPKPITTTIPSKPVTKTVTVKTSTTAKPPVKKLTWKSHGCFIDSHGNDRLISSNANFSEKDMTSEKCINHCQAAGFHYAATEDGVQCFCGNSVNSNGGVNHQTNRLECNNPCGGNKKEMCGGWWRAHLYHLE